MMNPYNERMKYYRVSYIEGVDEANKPMRRVPNPECNGCIWARLTDSELIYKTTRALPPARRRLLRKPRIRADGFDVEVEEKGKKASVTFTLARGVAREDREGGPGRTVFVRETKGSC